ncbi:hypothetical protein I544_5456 [Mycobacteroides abscessus subsp. bolletii 103]|nr:hypothetical protein I544_4485 [Mycobacteroides abscessus subsp. bolletii 103]EUA85052.1 hypothetical protein I544_5456 [Mycobacteroides abscessus subsp. bolletii 103]
MPSFPQKKVRTKPGTVHPDEAREHGWKLDHGDTLPADLEVLRFGATVRLFDDGSFLAVVA